MIFLHFLSSSTPVLFEKPTLSQINLLLEKFKNTESAQLWYLAILQNE